MLYKFLSARNPHHDVELAKKIRLLYKGGYAAADGLKKLIVKAPGETQQAFEYRRSQASYMPYFGQLVDYLVGAMFQNPLHITPAGDADDPDTIGDYPDPEFYQLFARNADRKGCHFSQLMRDSITEALLCHCAWVAVDMPPAVQAENRREEDELGGSRGYAYLLPFEEIFDWKEDDDGDGDLAWAIVGRRCTERDDPEALRETYYERYTLWRKNPVSGVVTYCIYQTRPVKIGDVIPDNEEIPELEPGETQTSFECIPLVRVELPDGLWAGNKVGPLAEEHYRRRCDMVGSMARSLHEIPFVKQGAEVPGVGEGISEAQSEPGRGQDPVGQFKRKGFVVLGSEDDIGFAGPSGRAYEITDTQLKELRDEIFRSVHAMALSLANTGATAKRSADSKVEDRRATGVVLDYLATKTRELAVNVYKTISDARQEDVVWVAHGLDDFDLEESSDLVKDAVVVQSLSIPSETFKKEYLTKVALSLIPGTSPETKSQIQQEICDGVEQEEELHEATQEAQLQEWQQPSAAQPGVLQVPGGPTAPNGADDGDDPPQDNGGATGQTAPKTPDAAPRAVAVPIHQTNATSTGIAETVYNQLADDFPPEALEWVRGVVWQGPIDVPLDSIDMSNSDTWAAAHEPDRVSFFDGEIKEGTVKPVILVNEPNNNKLLVVDGHHRVMSASEQNAETIPAFVAHVTTVTGPWDTMHAQQERSDSGPQ